MCFTEEIKPDVPNHVRSEADQNARNIMRDTGYDGDEDEDEDPGRRNKLHKAARKQYIEETRQSVKVNLEKANLPDQRVYLVSNDTLLSCVRTHSMGPDCHRDRSGLSRNIWYQLATSLMQVPPKKVIDEIELLTDILTQVVPRRSLC
ncbi:hypothetical protein EDC04DRAFT_2901391 [Pisolithus marmoratus]|nr:hypothetical protein EDC04DRAFT_2901391 [Pisolithus marmoratus]